MVTFVCVDNILGLLPEDVAMMAEKMMSSRWDEDGKMTGGDAFLKIAGAFANLGYSMALNKDWEQDDIIGLVSNDKIFVTKF